MRKSLKYYKSLNHPITLETYTEDGKVHYSLEIPDLPGCGAHGQSFDEALTNLQDGKELWIKESLKRGLPVPEPVSEDDFSGKFLLRIPTKLHMFLSKQAKTHNLSLNQYVKSVLESASLLEYQEERAKKRDDKLLGAIETLTKKVGILEKRMESFEDVFRPHPTEDIYVTDDADYGAYTPSGIRIRSTPKEIRL